MTKNLTTATPKSIGVDDLAQITPIIAELPVRNIQSDEESIGIGARSFSALRHRDFRFLMAGTVFMSAGQWIQQVTLGWLIYDMTGSSLMLGVLNGIRMLPFLVLTPAAGVAADRMDRRRLLLSSQVLLLVTAFIMGILVIAGRAEVWHLFVFTLITGMAWSFNSPVRQALVPSVVPQADLPNAVALNSMGFHFTKMIAPTLGGLLIVWFGGGGNFLAQSVTYLGVLWMIYLMHIRPLSGPPRHSSALADMKDGLKYVVSSPLILGLVLVSLVSRIFAMPYQTLMPVFQKDILGVGPDGLGMLMAAPGVGAVLATLLLTRLANRLRHRGVILIGSLLMLGIFLIAFSQTNSLFWAMLTLVGVGGFQMFFVNLSMVMLQMLVPDELRGRVLSIYMLDHGLMPAGALLAGVATTFVGAPVTVAIMGTIVILLALLAVWTVPQLREVSI